MSVLQALVDCAVGGDEEALCSAIEQAAPRVRGALHGAIPTRWQSLLAMDDVMQQAYADAFLGIGGFVWQGEGSFEAWLTTLAKRTLLDAVRMLERDKRGGTRRRVPLGVGDGSEVLLIEELISERTGTPSRVAARDEAVAALRRALGALPAAQRTVVERYDLAGQEAEVVAAEIGRSVGAVYMLRARAHTRLGEMLEGVAMSITRGGP